MQKTAVYFAYKIKDGIYVGTSRAHLEQQFLNVNKITYFVNCAQSEIAMKHPKRLEYDWLDQENQLIITQNSVEQIFSFIEEAHSLGEGVLIVSTRGKNRSFTVMTAYLMRKYSWGLCKALEYIYSRRTDFQVAKAFLCQLIEFERVYFKNKVCNRGWADITESSDGILLKNTYLNSKAQVQQKDSDSPKKKSTKQVRWSEAKPIIIPETKKLVQLQYGLEPTKSILKVEPVCQIFKLRPKKQLTTDRHGDQMELVPVEKFLIKAPIQAQAKPASEALAKRYYTPKPGIQWQRQRFMRAQSPSISRRLKGASQSHALQNVCLDKSFQGHLPKHQHCSNSATTSPLRMQRERSGLPPEGEGEKAKQNVLLEPIMELMQNQIYSRRRAQFPSFKLK